MVRMFGTSLVSTLLAFVAATSSLQGQGIWPEHPRPDFARSPWVNLNGPWQFAFDPDERGEADEWYKPGKGNYAHEIVVPFPWESPASGIARPDYRGVAWYRRAVTLPDGPAWRGRDAWLVVGACDWQATVWVNGQPAGRHVGGYVPFAINLSRWAEPGAQVVLVIRAEDRTDPHQPMGKQVDWWYTHTSGIWQTVYIEPRGQRHIDTFRALPDIGKGGITYEIRLAGAGRGGMLTLSSPDGAFATVTLEPERPEANDAAPVRAFLSVREPRLWSPDTPVLYPVQIVLRDAQGNIEDTVETYFGLREISVGPAPGGDYTYVYLNGEPIYLRGALHQSLHPEGIYQYPDDTTLRGDYELCKQAGLNFVRIHIKAPIPRALYWADRLGVLVMQDMPNFWEDSPQARRWWQETFEAVIERDFNHPSVFSWCLFNETWGFARQGYTPAQQRFVASMYERAKHLDPTRLVEDNSPCLYDHVVTDINSWHFYINDYERARAHIREVVDKTFPGSPFNYAAGFMQDDAPLINSEFGGVHAGMGDQDISWSLKYLTNELRLHGKIGGYVYTELTDIEWEHNGLVNYDRTPKEFGYEAWHPGFTLADINSADFLAIDAPPMIEMQAGQKRELPIRVSHFSGHRANEPAVRWCVDWLDDRGRRHEGSWQRQPAEWRKWEVVEQPPLTVEVPEDAPGKLGTVRVELVDGQCVLARNYVHLLVERDPPPRVEMDGADAIALRFEPDELADWGFETPVPMGEGIAGQKISGEGAGFIQYRLELPDGVTWDRLAGVRVRAELAARAGDAKLAWQGPRRQRWLIPPHYPQTDVHKWPTDVTLLLNGRAVGTQTLPDDPADARGALSHHHGYQGSYGYLTEFEAETALVETLRGELASEGVLRLRWQVDEDAKHKGGLAIFGERLGRYPCSPTIELAFDGTHGLKAGRSSQVSISIDRLLDGRRVLLPTAEQASHEWRYTTDEPGDDWTQPDYDDRSWQKGPAAFGSDSSEQGVATRWSEQAERIWLRTEFDVADRAAVRGGRWRFRHREDVEIDLNGRRVVNGPGRSRHYVELDWDADTLAALRTSRNILAVTCRSPQASRFIDVGAQVVVSPSSR